MMLISNSSDRKVTFWTLILYDYLGREITIKEALQPVFNDQHGFLLLCFYKLFYIRAYSIHIIIVLFK